MSKKDELFDIEGTVVEVLPNSMFRVELDTGNIIICYMNGKLRQHRIKIVLGDRVKAEMSVYDLTKGRITYRL